MSYQSAIEAAGATVHSFKEFGSYQGEWWALVTFEGRTGWVNGSYGSCSGCDSFQAEFDYSSEKCDDHKYDFGATRTECAACDAKLKDYNERLEAFGRGYLDNLMSQDKAEEDAAKHFDWDMSAQEMVDWIKANPVESANSQIAE